MKKVLVFRHVPHEGLGTIEPFLKQSNVAIEYCDLFKQHPVPQNLDPYSFVISMGGPMNVDETDRYPFLASERTLMAKAIRENLPVLGICLGAQMIARALGARVYRGPQKEIGWYPVHFSAEASEEPMFKDFSTEHPIVFHWHGDTFDLPPSAVRLAASDGCPNQAFRYRDSAYAFQFHVEVTREMIQDWVAKNQTELMQSTPPISGEEILNGIPKYIRGLEKLTQKIYPDLFRKLSALKAR